MFVHLGATDELKDPNPRTQAILEFINHNKLPFLQKSPDPNNKDWIKDILDEINTSIVINQQESCAKWNRIKIDNCTKTSVIDQFLFCPIDTLPSQHDQLMLSEKLFTKNVNFITDFHENDDL